MQKQEEEEEEEQRAIITAQQHALSASLDASVFIINIEFNLGIRSSNNY